MNATRLVWYCRTPKGWKRFPVVQGKNGRVKRGAVLIEGKERIFSDGHFELRSYENRKTVYRNVGDDPLEAVNAMRQATNLGIAQKAAEEAGVTLNETAEERRTIKKAAEEFAQDAERRGAMEAAEVNRAALVDYQLANPKLVYVDEINAETCTIYWAWLRKQGLKDRTIYNRHMRLTGFLRFCDVDYKHWRLRAPRYEKRLPDVYEPEQIDAMLAACKRDYHRMLILILSKTGLRDQEAQFLCWSDIDLKRHVLRVTSKAQYNFKIKDYEERDVPLSTSLVDALKAWREQRKKDVLVLPTSNKKPNGKLLPMLKGIAKRAGVANATLHRFRRTFCTNLLRGGMDLRTVQAIMGHSDIASTMRYLTPATGDAVKAKINEIL